MFNLVLLYKEIIHFTRKEFVSFWGNGIPCRVDPFQKGQHNNFGRVATPQNASIPLKTQALLLLEKYNPVR